MASADTGAREPPPDLLRAAWDVLTWLDQWGYGSDAPYLAIMEFQEKREALRAALAAGVGVPPDADVCPHTGITALFCSCPLHAGVGEARPRVRTSAVEKLRYVAFGDGDIRPLTAEEARLLLDLEADAPSEAWSQARLAYWRDFWERTVAYGATLPPLEEEDGGTA